MREIVRWLAVCVFALSVLPASGLADDKKGNPDLYDCAKPKCSEWAPKGENTCRTCTTVQCRKEGEKELIAGNKKTNECYPGHGDPPPPPSEEETGK